MEVGIKGGGRIRNSDIFFLVVRGGVFRRYYAILFTVFTLFLLCARLAPLRAPFLALRVRVAQDHLESEPASE